MESCVVLGGAITPINLLRFSGSGRTTFTPSNACSGRWMPSIPTFVARATIFQRCSRASASATSQRSKKPSKPSSIGATSTSSNAPRRMTLMDTTELWQWIYHSKVSTSQALQPSSAPSLRISSTTRCFERCSSRTKSCKLRVPAALLQQLLCSHRLPLERAPTRCGTASSRRRSVTEVAALDMTLSICS